MTKNLLSVVFLFMFICTMAFNVSGKMPDKSHSTIKGLNCSACHECVMPTSENPCLKLSAEFFRGEGENLTPRKMPPDTVIIKVLEDIYEPVKFPHRKHLHMAQTTFDCTECHHFAPPGETNPPCAKCHNPDEYRREIELVGLKAAYHRRCLTCHVRWSNVSNCELCHASKDKEVAMKLAKLLPEFREIKEPEKKVFINRMFTGPYVTFFHTDHTKKNNVYCADCHEKWTCVSCHYQTEEQPLISGIHGTGVHGTCRLCHETIGKEVCVTCHAKEEKEKMAEVVK